MKTTSLILIALFVGTGLAHGQYEFSCSGYVVDIPSLQELHVLVSKMFNLDRQQSVNVTRMRLRPSLSLWTGAKLSLEYEISSLYHSTPLVFSNQSEDNGRQIVPLRWTLVDNPEFTSMHFVDRFHLNQTIGNWDIVVGRQRIAWGTGRIWNPTDLFNPINPTSFAKLEKDGVDAALVRYHLGNFTDISVVFNPQKDWKTQNAGFRFRTNYREFDISVMSGVFDKRFVLGGDFAGNLMDAGVRGEGILSMRSDQLDSNFVKCILGIDYQLTAELYGLLEYHFNGEGAKQKSGYDLQRLAKGAIINVGRNYATVQISYLIHPLVNTLASYTHNFDDGSQFAGIAVSYSATNDLSLGLGGQLFLGDEYSEFWWYPNSLYLKAELFF